MTFIVNVLDEWLGKIGDTGFRLFKNKKINRYGVDDLFLYADDELL